MRNENEIKLYVWVPNGHGEYSFFVMAASEKEAKDSIENYISEHKDKNDGHYLSDYSIGGWGTDYYTLEIFSIGEVVTHPND